MYENKTKKKLREGKAVIGCSVGIDNLMTTRVMSSAGFDFLLIDMQHGVIGTETLFRMINGLVPTESEIIVRVIWNDIHMVNQVLDFGADGVIIPLTNTAEEVEQAVTGAKYPPDGIRSWGPKLTEKYGGQPDYYKRANDEILVLPQIESVEAVDSLDEILKVKGVDGIMIGPNDMALSMGLPAGIGQTGTVPMFTRVLDKCKEHGVPWGMFTSTLEIADQWLSQGGQIGIVGGDVGFVTEGAATTSRQVKELQSRLNGT